MPIISKQTSGEFFPTCICSNTSTSKQLMLKVLSSLALLSHRSNICSPGCCLDCVCCARYYGVWTGISLVADVAKRWYWYSFLAASMHCRRYLLPVLTALGVWLVWRTVDLNNITDCLSLLNKYRFEHIRQNNVTINAAAFVAFLSANFLWPSGYWLLRTL